MAPRMLSGRSREGRGAPGALALLLAILLPWALAACSIPREIDPRVIYAEVTGEIDAGRERPPGLDKPFPNLGTVPPRPERPDPAARAAITQSLEANRGQSRVALAPRFEPAAPGAAAPGSPALPAAPPPPPRLAGAAPVPWASGLTPGPAAGAIPGAAPGTTPVTTPGAVTAPSPPAPEPGEVPSAPPPDLLAAPPPLPRIN